VFGLKVSRDSSAAARWSVEGHRGGMYAVGAGGPLTGRGGNLLLVDDPVKNPADALSRHKRDALWDWFNGAFYSRREPNAKTIIIMTRWHEDDLCGRLLDPSVNANASEWRHVRLAAIADDSDPLGRAPGEALWPARYPVDTLHEIQRQLTARWFEPLYQQHPTPDIDGALWTAGLIDAHRIGLADLPDLDFTVVAVDPAIRRAGDAAGIVVVSRGANGHVYVRADRTINGTPEVWAQRAALTYHEFDADAVVVEDNQGGEMCEATLRQADAGMRLIAVHAKDSKLLRAAPVQLHYVKGLVHHVGSLGPLELEMCHWVPDDPDSPNRLDALVHGVTYLGLERTAATDVYFVSIDSL